MVPIPDDSRMTFWDHLEVLRWSLIRIAAVLVILVIVCFLMIAFRLLVPTNSFRVSRRCSKVRYMKSCLIMESVK